MYRFFCGQIQDSDSTLFNPMSVTETRRVKLVQWENWQKHIQKIKHYQDESNIVCVLGINPNYNNAPHYYASVYIYWSSSGMHDQLGQW